MSSSDDWPEWLPGDWTVQITKIDQKKVKFYFDPQGHKCYSKPQVLDHLSKTNKGTANESAHTNDVQKPGQATTGEQLLEGKEDVPLDGGVPMTQVPARGRGRPPKLINSPAARSSKRQKGINLETEPSLNPTEDNETGFTKYKVVSRTTVEGLPEGWIKEVRRRKRGCVNRKALRFLDPSSDYAFSSMKDALRYLETGDVTKCILKPVRRNAEETVASRTTAERLPEGWIKKLRTRKRSRGCVNIKAPSYLDPSGDYAFYSQKDALRYLETGDVTKCVMKPRRRNAEDSPDVNLALTEPTTPLIGTETSETATGKKFYSKPQVLNYLGIADSSISNKRKENALSGTPVSFVAPTSAEGKLDALRFLETGESKVKDKDGNEVFVYTHDVQKPGQATTGEQLLEGKEDVPTYGAVPMTQVPPKLINSPAARSSKRQKGINLETEPSLNPTKDNETGFRDKLLESFARFESKRLFCVPW